MLDRLGSALPAAPLAKAAAVGADLRAEIASAKQRCIEYTPREGGGYFRRKGAPTALFLKMVHIQTKLPALEEILSRFNSPRGVLFIADENTEVFARRVLGAADGGVQRGGEAAVFVLKSGEASKNWRSVEAALQAAHKAGLGRDSLFIGVGGGVVTDIAGFAASIYMRGVSLCFAATSLLAMADAAIGGKTGFDIFNIKNLAGTFYPAQEVYICSETLASLPAREHKSGFAEIIKSALLDSKTPSKKSFAQIKSAVTGRDEEALLSLIKMAVDVKNKIVEEDPQEKSGRRALLNLGHTFGHALESALGLGAISHGEAVAWGIACAARLGVKLGITPEKDAEAIIELLNQTGYETRAPHPGLANSLENSAQNLAVFKEALASDKKKSGGALRFVVPIAECSARLVAVEGEDIKYVYQSAGI